MILYALEHKGDLLEFEYEAHNIEDYFLQVEFVLTRRGGVGVWTTPDVQDAERAATATRPSGGFHAPINPYVGHCEVIEIDTRQRTQTYIPH